MKITKRQLKKLILEIAKNPYGLAEDHALFHYWYHGDLGCLWILFNAEKTLSAIKEINETNPKDVYNFYDALFQNIKGVIQIDRQDGIGDGTVDPYGAYQISLSACQEGYGPLMYDLVMSVIPGGIYPDRGSTSDEARNMWKYYATRRPDVLKRYIDQYYDKQTLTPEDDGIRLIFDKNAKNDHKPFPPTKIFDGDISPDRYLNMVYSMPNASWKNNPEVDLLDLNFNMFINMIKKMEAKSSAMIHFKSNMNGDDIILALTGVTKEEFKSNYFRRQFKLNNQAGVN